MILTLLTFGDRLENHYQASFSILSFLRSNLISNVCVVTDRPNYYRYFGTHVDIIEIDDETMTEWRGHHDFFWRIKMKGIEAAVLRNPGSNILYVDSDTFYVKDLAIIKQGLDQGISFMHEREGTLYNSSSKTFTKMWNVISNKSFSDVTIDIESAMWNAGVIAINGEKAKNIINHAIDICDAICATPCTRRLVEQFAFSIALQNAGELRAAENQIAHYWGNKAQWNAKIVEFLMYTTLSGSTLEEDLLKLDSFDAASLPTVHKEKSIKGKVNKALDSLFPPKEIQYFKGRSL